MTDREFRRKLIQHRRDKTLKLIIVLICVLMVLAIGLIGAIYLLQGGVG